MFVVAGERRMRRTVSCIILALLLVGTLALAFNVRLVNAQAATTVYINSDGSVSPSSAPISSADNVTYIFTGNMTYPAYNGIVVERNDTVIDGNGYTVQGEGEGHGYGLTLTGLRNVTIENANVQGFNNGIYLNSSLASTIIGNNATANSAYGIYLSGSSDNTVSGNNAIEAIVGDGIGLSYCNYTSVSGNNVSNDYFGIDIGCSNNINVSGNNAIKIMSDGIHLSYCNYTSVSGNNVSNDAWGIVIEYSNNITVSGNSATGCGGGISIAYCSSDTVNSNNLTDNGDGIDLGDEANNDIVSDNTVTNGAVGIELESSSNNTVRGNDVAGNSFRGIFLWDSYSNIIYHNSIIGNAVQAIAYYVVFGPSNTNTWDDGYPSGGNYWSDYNGTDLYSGPYQNVTGSDGIGDTPYVIVSLDQTFSTSNTTDVDHYPLMGPFSDFSVGAGVDVQVVSNSTVSDFQYNGTAILFNVSGLNGTIGFCNVCVPTALLNGTLSVFVNGTQVQYSLLPISNSSVSYLYFTYGHSTEQVIIMPEFPDSLILAILMLATLSAIVIHKKKYSRS